MQPAYVRDAVTQKKASCRRAPKGCGSCVRFHCYSLVTEGCAICSSFAPRNRHTISDSKGHYYLRIGSQMVRDIQAGPEFRHSGTAIVAGTLRVSAHYGYVVRTQDRFNHHAFPDAGLRQQDPFPPAFAGSVRRSGRCLRFRVSARVDGRHAVWRVSRVIANVGALASAGFAEVERPGVTDLSVAAPC